MFLTSLSWALQDRVGKLGRSRFLVDCAEPLLQGHRRAAASPDPFTPSGYVICIEWKGVGDCVDVLPKGSAAE